MVNRSQISDFKRIVIFFIGMILFNSCITDEFRFGELKLKNDFETDITGPILDGKLELKDFINREQSSGVNGKKVTIQFPDGTVIPISEPVLFEPYILSENFPFSIQGFYELTTITLVFRVNNGTPLPLNLELRFYHNSVGYQSSPPVLPKPFEEGEIMGDKIMPVFTTDTVLLSEEQRLSFLNANRIYIASQFENNGYLEKNDTLKSDYPVDISVVLIGKVKIKPNNQ